MKNQTEINRRVINRKIQLYIAFLILIIFSGACSAKTDEKDNSSKAKSVSISPSEIVNSELDSVVNYLIDASVKDFQAHQPPVPVSFRNVRVRNLVGENSKNNYMICGQFLAQDKQTKDEWTPFATIKTSDFEQWIGSQSVAYCQDSKEISYKIKDLSSELKTRFDSIKKLKHLIN